MTLNVPCTSWKLQKYLLPFHQTTEQLHSSGCETQRFWNPCIAKHDKISWYPLRVLTQILLELWNILHPSLFTTSEPFLPSHVKKLQFRNDCLKSLKPEFVSQLVRVFHYHLSESTEKIHSVRPSYFNILNIRIKGEDQRCEYFFPLQCWWILNACYYIWISHWVKRLETAAVTLSQMNSPCVVRTLI